VSAHKRIEAAIEGPVPGTYADTALTLAEEISFEEWAEIGALLGRIARSTAWWIGDWLCYGEATYLERYAQAVDDLGLHPQTLMNCASVCRRVARRQRRAGLSFSHHAEVASLDPEEQDRWLGRAEAEGWSRSELRRRLRNLPLAVGDGSGQGVVEHLTAAAEMLAGLTAAPAESLEQMKGAAERVRRELEDLGARSAVA
jgi:hypothetical protein